MERYGLIGHPLGHSFSADFFNHRFASEGRAARYNLFPMEHLTDLHAFTEQHPELRGLNVTIPHKQSVIAQLDALSPQAERIGAVNVVKIDRRPDGTRLTGHNPDIIGFCDSLRPLLHPHPRHALVLGTGGASKAVIVGLHTLGIIPRCVTRQRKSTTLEVGGCDFPLLEYTDLTPALIADTPLIVNCSPVGMTPHIDQAPRLPYEALTSRHLLYDLVYNPEETRFLALGRKHGAAVKNGLEMLHRQAIAAWDIWQED